jgi:hypothetical protein
MNCFTCALVSGHQNDVCGLALWGPLIISCQRDNNANLTDTGLSKGSVAAASLEAQCEGFAKPRRRSQRRGALVHILNPADEVFGGTRWLAPKSHGVSLRAFYRCQRCVRCHTRRTRCSGVSGRGAAYLSCNAAIAASVKLDDAIGRPSSSKRARLGRCRRH